MQEPYLGQRRANNRLYGDIDPLQVNDLLNGPLLRLRVGRVTERHVHKIGAVKGDPTRDGCVM
jgi:hypothetical protein